MTLSLLVTIASAFLFPFHPAANPADAAKTVARAGALYGNEIYFDVYRRGDKVGFHRVNLDDSGEGLTVRSTLQIEISVLFITAFRYRYTSEGQWTDGQLDRLKVDVDDDGTIFTLAAVREGQRMKISNTNGRYTTGAPLFPTNHWNAEVLAQTRVLNTLTGRLNNVRIEARARETVTTERGDVPATRYAYTGELDTEVWYDDAGRWVKMRFKGRDGTAIEYVCRRCQGERSDRVEM